jgi:hypothetical protein
MLRTGLPDADLVVWARPWLECGQCLALEQQHPLPGDAYGRSHVVLLVIKCCGGERWSVLSCAAALRRRLGDEVDGWPGLAVDPKAVHPTAVHPMNPRMLLL